MRWARRRGHLHQHDLHASTPRQLHRGDHIGIARDEHDAIGNMLMRHSRNIEPDAHINALLLEDRAEVGVGDGACSRRRLFWLPSAKRKLPTTNREAFALG